MTTRVLASLRLPPRPCVSSVSSLSPSRSLLASAQPKRSLHQHCLLSHASRPQSKSTPSSVLSSSSSSSSSLRGHRYSSTHSSPLRDQAIATSSILTPPKTPMWQKVAIGGTILLATSATLLNQLSKAPQMEALSSSSSSSTSTASAAGSGNVIQDLKDEHNRIGVEKKTTSELLLSMLVYKMCSIRLLVELSPKLISLAEMLHVTPPVYWFIRKTFFAQFCG